MQPTIWTYGPYFPSDIPEHYIPIIPKIFAIPVFKLKTLGILNPVIIALSYGIPLPDAARLT